MSLTHKECTRCKNIKNTTEFRKRAELLDGLSSWCKTCHKQHKEKNKQKESEANRLWYINNSEHARKTSKNYKKINQAQILLKNNKKYKEDKLFKLKKVLSSRLRSYTNGASNKIDENLGCSIEEFKFYLESQFQDGMNWDNHGEWHIDHICPCAQAQNELELLKLQHYSNLRPIWKNENLSKNASATIEAIEKCLILLKREWKWD